MYIDVNYTVNCSIDLFHREKFIIHIRYKFIFNLPKYAVMIRLDVCARIKS